MTKWDQKCLWGETACLLRNKLKTGRILCWREGKAWIVKGPRQEAATVRQLTCLSHLIGNWKGKILKMFSKAVSVQQGTMVARTEDSGSRLPSCEVWRLLSDGVSLGKLFTRSMPQFAPTCDEDDNHTYHVFCGIIWDNECKYLEKCSERKKCSMNPSYYYSVIIITFDLLNIRCQSTSMCCILFFSFSLFHTHTHTR